MKIAESNCEDGRVLLIFILHLSATSTGINHHSSVQTKINSTLHLTLNNTQLTSTSLINFHIPRISDPGFVSYTMFNVQCSNQIRLISCHLELSKCFAFLAENNYFCIGCGCRYHHGLMFFHILYIQKDLKKIKTFLTDISTPPWNMYVG